MTRSQSKLKKPWYDANDTAERNDKARSAYESLMTITLRKPDSERHKQFSKRVKDIAREQYNDTDYGDGEVSDLKQSKVFFFRQFNRTVCTCSVGTRNNKVMPLS